LGNRLNLWIPIIVSFFSFSVIPAYSLECPDGAYIGRDNQGNEACRDIKTNQIIEGLTSPVIAPSNQANQPGSSNQNSENNSSQEIVGYAAGIILLIIIIAIIAVAVSRRKRSSATYKPIVYSHDSSSRKDSKVALGSGKDERAISNSPQKTANFEKESSDPRKSYARKRADSYRNQSIVFFVLGALSFFGVFIHFFFFILAIIFFVIGAYLGSKTSTWDIGAEGEESVMRVLQKLDSSFKVVNDIVIPGDRQNIDHIVVGSAGIFVIETKNYNGNIRCYKDDWTRKKVGRRGTVYSAYVGNPSKQAKRNAIILRNWLQSENIDVGYINAVVVFANEDVKLNLIRPTVKVVLANNLLGVFNGESNYKMSNEKINSVAEKLYQLK